jgi:hypothetical protein
MGEAVRLLPAVAAIPVLSGVGALAQSDLPRSGQCGFRGGGFAYAGGIALPITMIMKNDGGWCGSLTPEAVIIPDRRKNIPIDSRSAHLLRYCTISPCSATARPLAL